MILHKLYSLVKINNTKTNFDFKLYNHIEFKYIRKNMNYNL